MCVDCERHMLLKILRKYIDPKVVLVKDRHTQVDIEFVSNSIDSGNIRKLVERFQANKSLSEMEKYRQKYRLGFRPTYSTKTFSRFWFTGENLRPPVGLFDGTLSFDKTDLQTKNFFFPYWYYFANEWTNISAGSEKFGFESLFNTRSPEPRARTAVTFSGEYQSKRIQIVKAVEKTIPVTKLGKFYGNSVNVKDSYSREHAFQICNENDLYPNYITEKLIDSWSSRNIPIWAGLDESQYFNHEAIINVTGLVSDEISEKIRGISEEEIMYRQAQPLLIKAPEFSDVIEKFRETIEKILK
jgi:hypothetical protein